MAAELSALGAATGYGQVLGAKPAPGGDLAENLKAAGEAFTKVFDKADQSVQQMAAGEGSAHAVVEAMAEAEVALQAAVTIRDRVVEAYQEILRMPV
ncbi:hypothetical protein PB2503_07959 [Parvularcula bermudensis HTCC2503]|uniref:Flagellar hook-basal body complex protein FliE n=1 Tax=Parvularcula bermudensis (strain ATCC BAA-594 / HTCC2503 / KCTC 12087) TaxID=314260 RepID=E0TH63_PARBH|nr:flagellar hook-basal body complex protein FliE [Parvularcula bermudensis]ADM09647.1 hypothetical protein PB2503_07959 [Parvularcula bermudensis HTCC2503]